MKQNALLAGMLSLFFFCFQSINASGPADCTSSCTSAFSSQVSLTNNNDRGELILSRDFKVTFEHYCGTNTPGSGEYLNIIEIRNSQSAVALLQIDRTSYWNTNAIYNGVEVITNHQTFGALCGLYWISYTITVTGTSLNVDSSTAASSAGATLTSNVATSGITYDLYTSRPSSDAYHFTAGGAIRNVRIYDNAPTVAPTPAPSTASPTASPSTRTPTAFPTTSAPTRSPTWTPTFTPTTSTPTLPPTLAPTTNPTFTPTTSTPTLPPTLAPTTNPSGQPTGQPSGQPFGQPSSQPSGQPTSQPSMQPSSQPSSHPSGQPSSQ
ncbi:hypothetical protein B484DRAFT_424801, partial [Ochromonadaceae sp. CCMP2298]